MGIKRNYKYDLEWIDKELKEKFLLENNINTYDNRCKFNKINYHELTDFDKPKSLYKYTYDDIIEMLKSFKSSSASSLSQYLDLIKDYLSFCKKENKVEDISFLTDIHSEVLRDLVDNEKLVNKYTTKDEIYTITKYDKKTDTGLRNPSDRAMILLIFEGIRGQNNEMLVNMKIDDVDFKKNIVKYFKSGKEKHIEINTDLAITLKQVINEDFYYNSNGKSKTKNSEKKQFVSTSENRYLFRPFKNDIKGISSPIKGKTIQNRILSSFKKYLNKPNITVESLGISGYIFRAIQYSHKTIHKKMTEEEFENFATQYDEIGSRAVIFPLYKSMYEKEADEAEEDDRRETKRNPDEEGGLNGEIAVEEYLHWKYKRETNILPCNFTKDFKKGYDFQLININNKDDTVTIEVKSSSNIGGGYITFYLSYHEMEIMRVEGNEYFLYFVYLSGKDKKAIQLNVIRNPIKAFNIGEEVDKMLYDYSGEIIRFARPQKYILSVDKKFLSQYEDTDFKKYLSEKGNIDCDVY